MPRGQHHLPHLGVDVVEEDDLGAAGPQGREERHPVPDLHQAVALADPAEGPDRIDPGEHRVAAGPPDDPVARPGGPRVRASGTDDVVMDTSSPAVDQAVITRWAWSSRPPGLGVVEVPPGDHVDAPQAGPLGDLARGTCRRTVEDGTTTGRGTPRTGSPGSTDGRRPGMRGRSRRPTGHRRVESGGRPSVRPGAPSGSARSPGHRLIVGHSLLPVPTAVAPDRRVYRPSPDGGLRGRCHPGAGGSRAARPGGRPGAPPVLRRVAVVDGHEGDAHGQGQAGPGRPGRPRPWPAVRPSAASHQPDGQRRTRRPGAARSSGSRCRTGSWSPAR